jgi:gluconolactonase
MKNLFGLMVCSIALAACSTDAPDGGNTTAAGSGGVGGSSSGGVGGSSGAIAEPMPGGVGGRDGAGNGGDGAGGAPSNLDDGGMAGSGHAGAAGAAGVGGGGAGGVDAGETGGTGGTPSMPVCPEGTQYPEPEAGTVTQDVCGDFEFAYPYNEGPTWIAREGAFFFTNFERGAAESGDIIKYTPGVGCERFIEGVGCNGLAVSNDGNLLGACHQTRSIEKFDLVTKNATTVAETYMGELLDSPNDLVQHENGGIYFTNPTYELDGRPQGIGTAIFWIKPDGILSRLNPTGNPNGIALTPDGSTLFVVGSGRWNIAPDGTPSNHQGGGVNGDGMAMDCAGNLYTSGGNIQGADGDVLGSFPGGTNLAFGGEGGTTLLVVHGYNPTSARTVQMNVPGLP